MSVPDDLVGVVKPCTDLWVPGDRKAVRDGLKALPWRPVVDSPGKYVRGPYVYRDVEFHATVTTCFDCGEEWPHTFMAVDSLWNSVASKKTALCIVCFEKRLGRGLRASDLMSTPANRAFIHLLRNGK